MFHVQYFGIFSFVIALLVVCMGNAQAGDTLEGVNTNNRTPALLADSSAPKVKKRTDEVDHIFLAFGKRR